MAERCSPRLKPDCVPMNYSVEHSVIARRRWLPACRDRRSECCAGGADGHPPSNHYGCHAARLRGRSCNRELE